MDGVSVYIYRSLLFERGRESKLGLTTRAIQTHEILYSALRLREKKKKRKISGTKDFWRTKKTGTRKLLRLVHLRKRSATFALILFFAFLQPR